MSKSREIRPLIGVPCGVVMPNGTLRHNLGDTYVRALIAAGAAPFMIPATDDEATLYSLYRSLDGLLISGGVDINPRYYQEEMNGSEEIDELRDVAELTLTRWALEDDLPVFGICRGHQVLNVTLGGSLYQDIPSQLPESQLDHRASVHAGERTYLGHSVQIDPDSKLAAITGATELMVNSLHHQSVKQPGVGLKVTGKSPDGVVEALESEEHTWVLSVQWHPEDLYPGYDWSRQLFGAFVNEVRSRKK